MKYVSATILVSAALVGCAGRGEPPKTAQTSSTQAQALTTTSATIPVEAPNMSPDPFNVDNAAPIRATADPPSAESDQDHLITNRVRQRVAGDSSLSDANLDHVTIMTANGHVHLRGWVPTLADKVTIEQRAREAQGVVDVQNDITTMDGAR